MQVDEVKDLIKAISESEIAEFVLEDDSSGIKLVLKKHEAVQAAHVQAVSQVGTLPVPAVSPSSAPAERPESSEEETFDDDNYYTVTAPMVGTFYRAPAPDADPYVQVGDSVTTGQALCIIEAMKLMNEIESEVDGRIVKILVENAQPVEYGEPLFVVEKA